jgi:hypothetical protein
MVQSTTPMSTGTRRQDSRKPSAVFDVATRLKRLSLSNNSERACSMMVFGSATMTLRISVINPPYWMGVTPDKWNLQPEQMVKIPP